jgi:hypothetical protein
MKVKRLHLKKEIVANLSDAEFSQHKGGTGGTLPQTDTSCLNPGCVTIGCGGPGGTWGWTVETCEWSYCCYFTYAGFNGCG